MKSITLLLITITLISCGFNQDRTIKHLDGKLETISLQPDFSSLLTSGDTIVMKMSNTHSWFYGKYEGKIPERYLHRYTDRHGDELETELNYSLAIVQ